MPRTSKEYRAVYSAPGDRDRRYGAPHETLGLAAHDRPANSIETLEEVVGVQVREVEPWSDMPLDHLVKALRDEEAGQTVAAPDVIPRRPIRDEPQA